MFRIIVKHSVDEASDLALHAARSGPKTSWPQRKLATQI